MPLRGPRPVALGDRMLQETAERIARNRNVSLLVTSIVSRVLAAQVTATDADLPATALREARRAGELLDDLIAELELRLDERQAAAVDDAPF